MGDLNRSGELSRDEWLEVMREQEQYAIADDCDACMKFIDKDGCGVLTSKDFDFLGDFDQDKFREDLRALYERLLFTHETIEAAFDAFEQQRSAASSARRSAKGLSCKDFLAGCRSAGFHGNYDPRFAFNFLDAMHVGRITRSEFMLLENLDACDALDQCRELMGGAIASLKAFAAETVSAEGGEELWDKLHTELKKATQDDFDLD